jgi:7-carboxy-7-deazaguanine synthase (Cx14CxxC type)
MTYQVNSIFYTLQGEGFWTGRPAVFVRFSRCNLWTGREKDRARAVCQFCDTDFTDSTKYERDELIKAIDAAWPKGQPNQMVVFTGGEPLLQLDLTLLQSLGYQGWYRAVETNGTIKPSYRDLLDWVCVSPKVNAPLNITEGDELKLVYPQGPDPTVYLGLKFKHFWLSPMDGPDYPENLKQTIAYVLADTRWRLNTQTHKQIGVR